jgi:hypothetical protein
MSELKLRPTNRFGHLLKDFRLRTLASLPAFLRATHFVRVPNAAEMMQAARVTGAVLCSLSLARLTRSA